MQIKVKVSDGEELVEGTYIDLRDGCLVILSKDEVLMKVFAPGKWEEAERIV